MFSIHLAEGALEDLKELRAHDRKMILDAVESGLKHEPDKTSRNRKTLFKLVPPWHTIPPVWELRVGEFRVFYDVNTNEKKVEIRAVRRKPPHKATEEIL